MLIIDNREIKLIELLKSTNISYEIKTLEIGDIIISNDKYPEKLIIVERKCMQDMLASIKDGRYKEQKIRLQAEKYNSNGNKIICYLIEGSSNDVRYPSEKKVFHGSLVSSIFRDELPLIRSFSLTETLDIIIRIHDRINKDITDFFKPNKTITPVVIPREPIIVPTAEPTAEPTTEPTTGYNTELTTEPTTEPTSEPTTIIDVDVDVDVNVDLSQNNTNTNTNNTNTNTNAYLNSIKKCKKENLTPQLWNQICLANIPSVSTNIASKITEIFPTLKKLFQAYDNCDTDEKRILLISEIILIDNGKTKRRIGEVVSKRILDYLYR